MSVPFWTLLSRLGEAQILLPLQLATALWLMLRSHAPRPALVWLACTGLAGALTLASKLAFHGWEAGYAPWNFTVVSGHAMFAAAVLPVLARALVADASPRRQALAVAAGTVLALGVAVSRVMVQAHSAPEAAAGAVLGLSAGVLALRGMHVPPLHAPRLLVAALLAWVAVAVTAAPAPRAHDRMLTLAVWLSGRPEPYLRWMMLRDYRHELLRRGEPEPGWLKAARHPVRPAGALAGGRQASPR